MFPLQYALKYSQWVEKNKHKVIKLKDNNDNIEAFICLNYTIFFMLHVMK